MHSSFSFQIMAREWRSKKGTLNDAWDIEFFSLFGAINTCTFIKISCPVSLTFFKATFHLLLPPPPTPPSTLHFQRYRAVMWSDPSHPGLCSLCPAAVLDPEWHHKGKHPFRIRVGWKEIPAGSGGLCPPPWLGSAAWRRHGWDWREGIWDTRGSQRVTEKSGDGEEVHDSKIVDQFW